MVGKTEWMRMKMRMSEDYVWACGSEKVGAMKRGRLGRLAGQGTGIDM